MRPFRPIRTALLLLAGAIPSTSVHGDEWPQWRGPKRDGVWRETGIVGKFDGAQIPILWRTPISSGYSGPTVAEGRVYVTDRQREPEQVERTLCFDWNRGKEIWAHTYPCVYGRVGYKAGPRASVLVEGGRAYALGTMGHLHCYDAATGRVLWKKTPGEDYTIRLPVWGVSASPLIEGDLLVVEFGARQGACVVALNKVSGAEVWRALDDRGSYSAPIVIDQAGRRVLVCWTGDSVSGLDPETGKVHWRRPFKPSKMPIGVPTPVIEGDRLFVSSFYDGSLMLQLLQDGPRVKDLWRRRGQSERNTDALHSMICTPIMEDGHIYGVDSYGQLRCLDGATGDRIWEDLTATPPARWSNIHMVRNGGKTWMFNERGELIIAELSPKGFEETDRAKLIEPTTDQLKQRGGVCWSHPAFAYGHIFARNDRELVCADLRETEEGTGQ